MLRGASVGSLSPKFERVGFKIGSHEFDDLTGLKSKLFPDRVKGRAVFPSHLNDSVGLAGRKFYFHRSLGSIGVVGFLNRIPGERFTPAAAITAKFDFIPDFGPLFPPFKRAFADRTDLFGKFAFSTGHHLFLLIGTRLL